MIAVYVHAATIRTYDYRELLETEHGVMTSPTGLTRDARHFAAGKTVEQELARLRAIAAEQPEFAVTIEAGEPVTRKSNMNPHGLM